MPKTYNDITGMRFGRLTALKYLGNSKWQCKCDCGNITTVPYNALKSGNTKSCGCLNNELIHRKRRNSTDLTGQVFGVIKVLEYAGSDKNGTNWKIECQRCGNVKVMNATTLKKSKSCGCLEKESLNDGRTAYKKVVEVTGTQPNRFLNDKPNRNNKTTGIKGVCYLKNSNEYAAYIQFQGKRKLLKRSKNKDIAIKARQEAEANLSDFLNWYKNWRGQTQNKKQ